MALRMHRHSIPFNQEPHYYPSLPNYRLSLCYSQSNAVTIRSVGRKGWPKAEKGAVRLVNLQQAAAQVGVKYLKEAFNKSPMGQRAYLPGLLSYPTSSPMLYAIIWSAIASHHTTKWFINYNGAPTNVEEDRTTHRLSSGDSPFSEQVCSNNLLREVQEPFVE